MVGDKTSSGETLTGTLVELYEAGKIKIGDYVNYQNPTSGTYTSTGDKNGMTDYSDSSKKEESTNQVFNVSNNQLNWRVLGIDETTGGLKLISGSPIRKESEYNDPYFYLIGAHAYEYGIEELNNICAMYKNSYALEARSITMADIEQILDINEEVKHQYSISVEDSVQYGQAFSYEDHYTPASWLNNTTKTTVSGVDNLYSFYINNSDSDFSINLDLNNENEKAIYDVLGINRGANYWIATQYSDDTGRWVEYGLYSYKDLNFSNNVGFCSHRGTYGVAQIVWNRAMSVRPVVVLSPEVMVEDINIIQDNITEPEWTGDNTEMDTA